MRKEPQIQTLWLGAFFPLLNTRLGRYYSTKGGMIWEKS